MQRGLGLGPQALRSSIAPDLLQGRLEAEAKGRGNLRVREPGGREAQPAQRGLDQRPSCCCGRSRPSPALTITHSGARALYLR